MIGRVLFRGALAGVLSLSLSCAWAQQAPPPGEGGPHKPAPKPTNLKVLPKSLSGDDVRKIMHGYEGALGVECSYCHVRNTTGRGLNFAADDKDEKATARVMIAMTAQINAKYLSQIKDHDHDAGQGGDHDDGPPKVTCGTCHRGHAHPEKFVPPPEKEHHGPPPAASPAPGAPS
jgi:hypothetical protein